MDGLFKGEAVFEQHAQGGGIGGVRQGSDAGHAGNLSGAIHQLSGDSGGVAAVPVVGQHHIVDLCAVLARTE